MAKKGIETTPAEDEKVERDWIRPNGMGYCLWCKSWSGKKWSLCRLCGANLIKTSPIILATAFVASEFTGVTNFTDLI